MVALESNPSSNLFSSESWGYEGARIKERRPVTNGKTWTNLVTHTNTHTYILNKTCCIHPVQHSDWVVYQDRSSRAPFMWVVHRLDKSIPPITWFVIKPLRKLLAALNHQVHRAVCLLLLKTREHKGSLSTLDKCVPKVRGHYYVILRY